MNLVLNTNCDPCREAALYLADFFAKLAQDPTNLLDFEEYDLNKTTCGTVACHGGWGCLLPNSGYTLGNQHLEDFDDGAMAIAQILGFDDEDHYIRWANYNPSKWGGKNGLYMFGVYGWIAFKKDRKQLDCEEVLDQTEHDLQSARCGLQDIADWYRDMASRLDPSDNQWSIEA